MRKDKQVASKEQVNVILSCQMYVHMLLDTWSRQMSSKLIVNVVKGVNQKGGGIYAKLVLASSARDDSLGEMSPVASKPFTCAAARSNSLFVYIFILRQWCVAVLLFVLVSSLARHEVPVWLRCCCVYLGLTRESYGWNTARKSMLHNGLKKYVNRAFYLIGCSQQVK